MTNPCVEYLTDKGRWRLIEPLITPEQTIPAGFETDGATVPRFLWVLVPRVGRYFRASIVHDYMYVNAIDSKARADELFLLNMQRDGVPIIKRNVMYFATIIFGRGNY